MQVLLLLGHNDHIMNTCTDRLVLQTPRYDQPWNATDISLQATEVVQELCYIDTVSGLGV